MIRDITITAKGDYQRITFSREEDSHTIDMSFSYPRGCSYASFNLEDMKKALDILEKENEHEWKNFLNYFIANGLKENVDISVVFVNILIIAKVIEN